MSLDTEELIRAADEGIPIGAIKRIFKLDSGVIRDALHGAVRIGRLVSLPKEDWPIGQPREEHLPIVNKQAASENDDDTIMKMARRLKTTRLESRILLVILRRGYAVREQLHDAVEDNRGNPADATQEKIVDVVVCKLRSKLEDIFKVDGKQFIKTVHSMGYEMSDEDRQKTWNYINGQA